jgi:hypothetical protein
MRPRIVPFLLLTLAALLLICGGSAQAAAGPGWSLQVLAQPARFVASSDEACEHSPGKACDTIALVATNAGARASLAGAPVTVADQLPAPLVLESIEGKTLKTQQTLACARVPLQCVATDVPAGESIVVEVHVIVPKDVPEASLLDTGTVSGGGAPAVTASNGLVVVSEAVEGSALGRAGFGIEDFSMRAFDEDGLPSVQAAGHPYSLATSLYFNADAQLQPPEEVKDVIVDLPPGLVGNPQATTKCPLYALLEDSGTSSCPPASRVGTVVFEASPGTFRASEEPAGETTAVYNMEPAAGFPAEFGFTYLGKALYLYASPVRIGGRLRLRVTVPGIPDGLEVVGSTLLFFGNPGERFNGVSSPVPFFTNPSACAGGPQSARAEADSWQHPGAYATTETTAYPELTGCNVLQFAPSLSAVPETASADQPSGYNFNVSNPQYEGSAAPGTPDLRDATVTLPAGLSLSPGVAEGLRGCPATGPEGINIGSGETAAAGQDLGDPEASELGAGHPGGDGSPYDDGLYHTAPGHCPSASSIGTVEIQTPLLSTSLTGHVYVAQPECGGEGQPACTEADALNGRLFKGYLEASGSGAIVKLAGEVSVDPLTGQITAGFRENPQLPFSKLVVHFDGGPRAPLANPQSCAPVGVAAAFTAWSAPFTPEATSFSPLDIDEDCGGGFSPSFDAQTQTTAARSFTPFSVTFGRQDSEQNISSVQVTTPAGLLGVLRGVERCPEPRASKGECGPNSQIGVATTAVGSGSHPFWASGPVYLTGPYKGAPFGLSVVVPAKAGPFNLGNVVVRAAISVNATTTALTVTSDPFPRILDGIPLRIKTVNVNIDRPRFMFNPDNCENKQITATIASTQGTHATVSSPFAVTGCDNMPFAPAISFTTSGKTSKLNGASLYVDIVDPPSDDVAGKVKVDLPKALPARLTTLQKACTAKVFDENPAACPSASIVGYGRTRTPVLASALEGPGYLVSNGGQAFPELVFVLQGEGIRFDLHGETEIKHGVTSSSFANIPDVPVEFFEGVFPEGPHSALGANGEFCKEKLTAPNRFVAENGKTIERSTPIKVTGCPKAKKKKRARASKTHRAGTSRKGARR